MSTTATNKLGPAAPATPPIAGIDDEVTSLKTSTTAFAAKKTAWEAAKAALPTAKADMDAAGDTAKDDMRALAAAIEAKAKGDPMVWAVSTLPLASAPAPKAMPGQISNLSVTASDMNGALDVHFDPEDNSDNYELEVTTVDPIAGPWIRQPASNSSSLTITGLTSGQRAWVRVRGHGTKGDGPWSDPATKIVP